MDCGLRLFLLGKTLQGRSGFENRFQEEQAIGSVLGCAWMWVAWVQNPSLPFRLKGKSLSHDSAAAASEHSREMKAPDPGPQRGATEKVGRNRGLQRSEEIREEGYSEDRALPWAEHTHAHKHTCRIHTPYKGLRVDANNNAATIQSLGQTKFSLEASLCRPHMLIANVLTF